MARLGGHSSAKYTTGTLLGSSAGRGWDGLLAERWRNSPGDLGEVEIRDTEVIVMIEGNLRIRRRGDGKLEHCHAVPGTVWLCPDGVREDMIRLYGEVRESIHLFLPAAPLSATALGEIGVDPAGVGLHYEGGFRDPLIERIAWAIRAEMLDPAPAGNMLVETLARALGVHILRHHSNLKPASTPLPTVRGALDPRRLRRVVDFMDAHLGEELTIERLAKEACLSPFHFARAFTAATGTAPHRHLTVRRIDRARTLIAGGTLSLAGIAAACGFSSQAHFTRSFKRFVGATPGEYRGACGGAADPREVSCGSATMNLTAERQGDVLIVAVSGRIDAAGGEAIREAIGETDRAAILDLDGLAHMGSTGLRAILLIAKDLANRDARLVLCALPAPIRRVFGITGFERLLPIHETRADALAALAGCRGGPQAP